MADDVCVLHVLYSFLSSFSQDCSKQATSACSEKIASSTYFALLSSRQRGSIAWYRLLACSDIHCECHWGFDLPSNFISTGLWWFFLAGHIQVNGSGSMFWSVVTKVLQMQGIQNWI